MEDIIYNKIMEDKSEVMKLSPRTGRPTDNPKVDKITVRLDKKSSQIMQMYCEQEGIEKAEAVRRGLKKLEDELKK